MVPDPQSCASYDALPGKSRVLSSGQWHGVDFSSTIENISKGTTWSINIDRHAVIVHLSGQIRKIETEIDGRSLSPALPLPGDTWIVPAGCSYRSEAQGGTIRYAVIEFDPVVLSRVADLNRAVRSVRPQINQSDPFLHRSVMQLAELTQRSDDLSSLTAASLGHTLLLHFLGGYFERKNKARLIASGARFTVKEKALVVEYIADYLHRPIRLEHLSEVVKMTSHELLQAFRGAFDMTPTQYIIKERLRRVQSLLLSSPKTITTIAVETGFSSHAHLSSTFSSRHGISPQAYRSAKGQ